MDVLSENGLTALVSAGGGAWLFKLLIGRQLRRLDELVKSVNDILTNQLLMQKDIEELSKHSNDHERVVKLEAEIRMNRREIKTMSEQVIDLMQSRAQH